MAESKQTFHFLKAICQHPKFKQVKLSTDFLSQEEIKLPATDKEIALVMAVSFDYLNNFNTFQDPLLQETFAWQSQISSHWIWRYKDQDEQIEAFITPIDKNHFKVQFKTQEFLIYAHLSGDKIYVETKIQKHHATVENKNNP